MITRRAGVRSREIEGGELALMNADDTTLILLNPLGAAVWELCQQPQSVQSLTSTLLECFADVEEAVVRADVKSFVARLKDLGVVLSD